MDAQVTQKLEAFRKKYNITQKGALSVVLHVTRIARKQGLPLDPQKLRTKARGQVRGLSRSSIQNILKDYGILRILAKEGGRTSRGSIRAMERYVAFLNELHANRLAYLDEIELWWIDQVKTFFAAQPFILRHDLNRSLGSMVQNLLWQADERQKENPGTTYVGSVLQHLVGAKLELVFKKRAIHIEHHGASVADAPTARAGDFIIRNVVVHVTTTPSQNLIQKCRENLDSGYRVIIVTIHERMPLALGNADIEGIADRIDVWAVEQFVATNLHELSSFDDAERRITIDQLINEYNQIVDACETDPSLQIRLGN